MSTDSLQFEELCLPIPKIVYTFSEEKQKEIYEY